MKYIKESLKDAKPYPTRYIKEGIILNANESPFDLNYNDKDRIRKFIESMNFNRYPDSSQNELILSYGKKHKLSKDEMIFSVGSDGIIEAVFKAVITKNDKVLTIRPTFTMYKEYAAIYEALFIEVDLDSNFNFTLELYDKIVEENPKLVIICSPNNPTGTTIDWVYLERIIKATKGIVLIDAAYAEFADINYNRLMKYDNVIIAKTASKAYGLASIRLGVGISNPANINMLKIVIPPFHINSLTLGIGLLFAQMDVLENVRKICLMRDRLSLALESVGIKVYPSKANFVFFEASSELVPLLEKRNIFLREIKYNGKTYVRMTIGKNHENDLVLRVIVSLNEKVYKI